MNKGLLPLFLVVVLVSSCDYSDGDAARIADFCKPITPLALTRRDTAIANRECWARHEFAVESAAATQPQR
jgi:hypothetical protein